MKSKEEIIKEIKQIKWYRQALNSKAYYIFNPWYGGMKGLFAKLNFIILKDKTYLEGIYNEDEMDKKAHLIVEDQKKDIHWIDEYLKKCKFQMERFKTLYKKYGDFDFNNADFEEVVKVLKDFEKVNYDYWVWVYLCDFFDPNGEEILQYEIKNADVKFEKNDLAHLLKPEKKSYVQDERLELLEIALDIKNNKTTLNDGKITDQLKKHAKKYYYVDNSWESSRILNVDDFKKKIEEIVSDNTIDEINEQVIDMTTDWASEHKMILKKHNIPKELFNLIYMYRKLVYLRDERKEYVMITNHFYDQCFLRISEILVKSF